MRFAGPGRGECAAASLRGPRWVRPAASTAGVDEAIRRILPSLVACYTARPAVARIEVPWPMLFPSLPPWLGAFTYSHTLTSTPWCNRCLYRSQCARMLLGRRPCYLWGETHRSSYG
eukprot:6954561-Prymnesium_polylepis.1